MQIYLFYLYFILALVVEGLRRTRNLVRVEANKVGTYLLSKYFIDEIRLF